MATVAPVLDGSAPVVWPAWLVEAFLLEAIARDALGDPGAAERAPELADEFESNGVEHWAHRTMAGRLGSDFPPEGVEWWIKFMGRTAVSTQIGFMKTIACADIRADVPQIRCPTLVITTDGSGLASVDQTRAWQQQIPHSRLLVLPGNSYHVAASHAARCSEATLDFIEHHPGAA